MMSENRENNSLSFPVPDKTEHDHGDPSHPTTGYNVAVEKESNGVTVTAEVTASTVSLESGSQGFSEIPDPNRQAPDRQSAISSDSPQLAAPQHEMQYQFDDSSLSRLPVKATTCHRGTMVTGRSPLPEGPFTNVSECKPKPTPQCAPSTVTLPNEVPDNMKLRNDVTSPPPPPPSSPQQHKIRQALNLSAKEQNDIESDGEGHSNSDCGEVPNSPRPIPAEMTDHSDAMVTGSSLLSDRPFTNMDIGAFSGLDFSGRVICLPPPIDKSAGSHHPSEDPPLYSSSEEVDAANAVQTCRYSLETYVLTPNERDQKYLERRDYNVLRDDVQGGFAVIKDVSTGALAVRKESKSERECGMLSNLNDNNVISFLGAVREKATVRLFLQHAPYGTVREQFRDNEYLQLRPDLISHIEEQVLQAVSYLHQEGIRHGDITGDNVAVFSNWLCKLTNFDQANSVNDVSKERTNKGPSYSNYSSPELIAHCDSVIADPKWSYSSDMWSAMLLFVEMMTGENPWHSSIERDVQYERFLQDAIFSKMYYVTKKISSYSEQRDYPKLVDEPLYQQRLQAEFGSTPEHARQLAIFDQLAALAKEVFVRDATRRPSANVLLNSLVMIKASTYIVKT